MERVAMLLPPEYRGEYGKSAATRPELAAVVVD